MTAKEDMMVVGVVLAVALLLSAVFIAGEDFGEFSAALECARFGHFTYDDKFGVHRVDCSAPNPALDRIKVMYEFYSMRD